MKKMKGLSCLLVIALLSGCANQEEKAISIARKQTDFKEIIYQKSIEASAKIVRFESGKEIMNEEKTRVINEIIYRTKTGGIKRVVLKDNNPPIIIPVE